MAVVVSTEHCGWHQPHKPHGWHDIVQCCMQHCPGESLLDGPL